MPTHNVVHARDARVAHRVLRAGNQPIKAHLPAHLAAAAEPTKHAHPRPLELARRKRHAALALVVARVTVPPRNTPHNVAVKHNRHRLLGIPHPERHKLLVPRIPHRHPCCIRPAELVAGQPHCRARAVCPKDIRVQARALEPTCSRSHVRQRPGRPAAHSLHPQHRRLLNAAHNCRVHKLAALCAGNQPNNLLGLNNNKAAPVLLDAVCSAVCPAPPHNHARRLARVAGNERPPVNVAQVQRVHLHKRRRHVARCDALPHPQNNPAQLLLLRLLILRRRLWVGQNVAPSRIAPIRCHRVRPRPLVLVNLKPHNLQVPAHKHAHPERVDGPKRLRAQRHLKLVAAPQRPLRQARNNKPVAATRVKRALGPNTNSSRKHCRPLERRSKPILNVNLQHTGPVIAAAVLARRNRTSARHPRLRNNHRRNARPRGLVRAAASARRARVNLLQ